MSQAYIEADQSQAQVFGQHVIVEYYGCNPEILNDLAALSDMLVEAARRSGATPVKREFHQFAPHGISGVVIITESHLTIHTWPEHGFAAVDVFMCGSARPERAVQVIEAGLCPTSVSCRDMPRGQPPHSV